MNSEVLCMRTIFAYITYVYFVPVKISMLWSRQYLHFDPDNICMFCSKQYLYILSKTIYGCFDPGNISMFYSRQYLYVLVQTIFVCFVPNIIFMFWIKVYSATNNTLICVTLDAQAIIPYVLGPDNIGMFWSRQHLKVLFQTIFVRYRHFLHVLVHRRFCSRQYSHAFVQTIFVWCCPDNICLVQTKFAWFGKHNICMF